ncbi:helix-turn-helix domain-containing protein [Muricauda sp. TY007]|uniref:helix-turn-helix domain-containing protein n=1 Tax=Allomuricauda sp. TY007 TaxID=2683200 RepID=UPI0013BF5915|nr:helix-turn-helix domain-containing protein [Muricauda sp. TY007]NDV15772.1 helix-turn-helix domain-containing protein [Muricauda sp. TY007]
MYVPTYVAVCVFSFFAVLPQQRTKKGSDTIMHKSYDVLFDTIRTTKDPTREQRYLKAFLLKAQQENNVEEIVNGYKNYLHHSEERLRHTYADSMIHVARKSGDSALIGSAYLTKGFVYYGEKDHTSALDHYIMAYDYLKHTDDAYQKHKVQYMIGHIKYYLGYYEEAIRLFQDCIAYYQDRNTRPYLNSLHSLGLCYNRMGNYGLSSETNARGLEEADRSGNHSMDVYFKHSEGVNHYFRENYKLAIETLEEVVPQIADKGDFGNESVGYFYLGRSYWALKQPDRAIPYFKKVDKIFNERDYLRPDLREGYELLIDHYEELGNNETQLYYIKQLLKADKSLAKTYRYLSGQIHREYTERELLQKESKIEELLAENEASDLRWGLATGLLVIAAFVLVYRRRMDKRKFKKLMQEIKDGVPRAKVVEAKPEALEINPVVAEDLLKQLQKFEEGRGFLKEDLNLVKLAASFNANNKYLSKIITHYKGKGIVEYINDLKIDYIIELFTHQRIYRKYNYNSLSKEAGFSSVQRFVRAFKHRTGSSPANFCRVLDEQEAYQEGGSEALSNA